jgi:cytochrome c oxidase subunit 2
MPIVVDARSETDFAAWLTAEHEAVEAERGAAARTLSISELMAHGREVYTANCAACHQPGGEGMAGTFPPLKGSPVAKGPLDAHLVTVLHGRPGTAMPSFAQLSDRDIAAVLTFERNAWGNNTGDAVQAAQVQVARTGTSGKAAQQETALPKEKK